MERLLPELLRGAVLCVFPERDELFPSLRERTLLFSRVLVFRRSKVVRSVLRARVEEERTLPVPSAERVTPVDRDAERVTPPVRVRVSSVRVTPPVRTRVPSVRTV